VGNFVDDAQNNIQQSDIGAKLGAVTAFMGAMGTWILDHSEIISLSILFAGFAVGVFFSWRKDKYLKRECERREIEHEYKMGLRIDGGPEL
jgi:hypothetical protein